MSACLGKSLLNYANLYYSQRQTACVRGSLVIYTNIFFKYFSELAHTSNSNFMPATISISFLARYSVSFIAAMRTRHAIVRIATECSNVAAVRWCCCRQLMLMLLSPPLLSLGNMLPGKRRWLLSCSCSSAKMFVF